MNSFLELAKQRCSVRAYKSDRVEAEKLDYYLNDNLMTAGRNHGQISWIISLRLLEWLHRR